MKVIKLKICKTIQMCPDLFGRPEARVMRLIIHMKLSTKIFTSNIIRISEQNSHERSYSK